MYTHPNARLTPLGREGLLRRHIDHGESLAFLAAPVTFRKVVTPGLPFRRLALTVAALVY